MRRVADVLRFCLTLGFVSGAWGLIYRLSICLERIGFLWSQISAYPVYSWLARLVGPHAHDVGRVGGKVAPGVDDAENGNRA